MKSISSALRSAFSGLPILLPLLIALGITSGCVSPNNAEQTEFSKLNVDAQSSASEELRPGDALKITFKGPSIQIPDHDERVPESGEITLPYIGKVKVIGKTRVKLQDEITELYVPKYFKELTVTIDPADRFFYIYGEVKLPNRYQYGSKMTVMGAISTAGGYTDYANQKKIQLIRTDNQRQIVNGKKAREDPQFDPEVRPGDRIFVPRRLW